MKLPLGRRWAVLLVTGGSVALSAACRPAGNEYAEPPAPAVTVASPLQRDVTLFVEETGQLESAEQAEVRARVRGFVEEILFKPGDRVAEGEELYRIERDEYVAARDAAAAALAAAEAAVLVARAELKSAETEVAKTVRDFARQQELLKQNATSRQEYESVLAARDAAQATRESAQAAVEAAKSETGRAAADLKQADLDLRYTVVTAPIAGSITKTEVKLGNLVENGVLLATIVDDAQIYANFHISDREILQYLERAQAASEQQAKRKPERHWTSVPVYLRRESDADYPFQGRIDYVDQTGFDAPTGTLAVRAVFDNSRRALLPGLFVYLRIPQASVPQAILVPEAAVRRDPTGTHLLTVGPDAVIQRRDVELGAKQDRLVVVASGLSSDDLVVIEGLQRARPGTAVKPQRVDLAERGFAGWKTAHVATAESSPTAVAEQPAHSGSD